MGFDTYEDGFSGNRHMAVSTVDLHVNRAIGVNDIYDPVKAAVELYIKDSIIGGGSGDLVEYLKNTKTTSATYDTLKRLYRFMQENEENLFLSGVNSNRYGSNIFDFSVTPEHKNSIPVLFFRWNSGPEPVGNVKNSWERDDLYAETTEKAFNILGLDVQTFGEEYISNHPDIGSHPNEHSYMGLSFSVPSPYEVEELIVEYPNKNLNELKVAVGKYAFERIKLELSKIGRKDTDDYMPDADANARAEAKSEFMYNTLNLGTGGFAATRLYEIAPFRYPDNVPGDERPTPPIRTWLGNYELKRDPLVSFKRETYTGGKEVGSYWYEIKSEREIQLFKVVAPNILETLTSTGLMQSGVASWYGQQTMTGSNSTLTGHGNYYPKKLALDFRPETIDTYLTSSEAEILASFAMEGVTLLEVKLPEYKKPSWRDSFKEFFGALISVVSISFLPGVNFVGGVASVSVGTLVGAYASNIAMKEFTKLAVKLGIPPEAIAVLTTLITIQLGQGGGVGINIGNLANAKDMLKLVNMAVEVTQIRQQQQVMEMRKEVANFEIEKQKQLEELNKVQNLLDTGVSHSLYDLLVSPNVYGSSSYNYLGESPDEFYTRTTIVDVGPITMDYVKSFADITSSLPRAVPYRIVEDDPVESVLLLN